MKVDNLPKESLSLRHWRGIQGARVGAEYASIFYTWAVNAYVLSNTCRIPEMLHRGNHISHPDGAIKKIWDVFKDRFLAEKALALWVAPEFYCIAEFAVRQSKPAACAWYHCAPVHGTAQLQRELQKTINRRILQGRTVVLALSTPDVYACRCDNVEQVPLEQQNLLPPALKWDDLEYCAMQSDESFFACMRHEDVQSWNSLLSDCGLMTSNIVPSGPYWPNVLDSSQDIICRLQTGDLLQRVRNGKWQGSLFCTEDTRTESRTFSLNAAVRPEFQWCPLEAIPVLEAIMMKGEQPSFTLNPLTFQANDAQTLQHRINRYLLNASLALSGILLLLLLLLAVTRGAELLILKNSDARSRAASIHHLRQENQLLRSRLQSESTLLARKSAVASHLHSIGTAVGNSLWLSELKTVSGNERGYIIIGHALNEAAVAQFMKKAEALPGIVRVNLEYTEKVSPQQTSRLTGGRKRTELWRYKVVVHIAERP